MKRRKSANALRLVVNIDSLRAFDSPELGSVSPVLRFVVNIDSLRACHERAPGEARGESNGGGGSRTRVRKACHR